MQKYNLLSVGNRTIRSPFTGERWLQGVLYLAPGFSSGYEACPNRTEECTALCIAAGKKWASSPVVSRRRAITRLLFEDKDTFMSVLDADIRLLKRTARRIGAGACVMLNGSSDIPWERLSVQLFRRNRSVQFHDFTMSSDRWSRLAVERSKTRHTSWEALELNPSCGFPRNYDLTFMSHGQLAGYPTVGDCKLGLLVRGDMPRYHNGLEVHRATPTSLTFTYPDRSVLGIMATGVAHNTKPGRFSRHDELLINRVDGDVVELDDECIRRSLENGDTRPGLPAVSATVTGYDY